MSESNALPRKVSFLGFGKMGQAIAGGLKKSNPGIELSYFDVVDGGDKDQTLARRFESPVAAEEFGDIMILGVKPADMAGAVSGLQGNKKYISIAAGLSVSAVQSGFQCSEPVQVARVMPNISALIGESVSAVYCEDDSLRDTTLQIFGQIGRAVEVQKEDLMHAVTGLSGSGPAYVFAMIQALAEGGVLAGLPYDTARELAAGTVRAAAEMLLQDPKTHPDSLRNAVTSPGGTTIAGLKVLEDRGFHGALMEAVRAAAARSRELGS